MCPTCTELHALTVERVVLESRRLAQRRADMHRPPQYDAPGQDPGTRAHLVAEAEVNLDQAVAALDALPDCTHAAAIADGGAR